MSGCTNLVSVEIPKGKRPTWVPIAFNVVRCLPALPYQSMAKLVAVQEVNHFQ
eukprot:CAMPEP_0113648864 /NCGR_PEP_ID=MMETSP0017_2-20120614/25945_1 /TAXON_ID=2856 /ORGANISM="Cylindrotheca closterium" /LENGTH=52 /DNA_ID=CAMNT_0000561163 /DNA_START=283 /DNA_END=438 /DNA_ORIENTATION=+ /assembly_acc=CAM_ASM_000147